jgi:hypothetical protein
LRKPLKGVAIYHNDPNAKPTSGTSTGYLYAIDSDQVIDNLENFSTNPSDYEFIYPEAIKPIKIIPIKINWTARFDKAVMQRHGKAQ